MYFAIRDDDTSFFTKPDELNLAYSFIKDGCVSLSVVPYTVPIHKDTVFPYGDNIKYDEYSIMSNHELISYLSDNHVNGKYDILLHGYSHEYKKVGDKWQPEMIWKDEDRIVREMSDGKKMLEKILNCKITVFVAPNNRINRIGIDACEKLRMNYSGIIKLNDRKIDAKYIQSFIKRYAFKLFCGMTYGGVLHYSGHDELFAHPIHSYDNALYYYKICKEHNFPCVVFTHYHVMIKDSQERENLIKLYNYVTDDGAELLGISRIFSLWSGAVRP